MRDQYVLDLLMKYVDKPTAELIIEQLVDEGLLVLGYGDKDVERIVSAFKTTFGTTKVTKPDRYAAHRLASKYSPQAIVGIITMLGKNQGERFAPVVNSVSELESKLPSVLNFLRKDKNDVIAI